MITEEHPSCTTTRMHGHAKPALPPQALTSNAHILWRVCKRTLFLHSPPIQISMSLNPKLWSSECNIVNFSMDGWSAANGEGITHLPATAWVTWLLSLWLIFNCLVCTNPGLTGSASVNYCCIGVNLKFYNKPLNRAEMIDPVEFASVRCCKGHAE